MKRRSASNDLRWRQQVTTVLLRPFNVVKFLWLSPPSLLPPFHAKFTYLTPLHRFRYQYVYL